MIKLQKTSSSQTITFIPRFYSSLGTKTSTNQILYRDKIFVTNQTATYSINNAEYSFKSESATEDQFKMYE